MLAYERTVQRSDISGEEADSDSSGTAFQACASSAQCESGDEEMTRVELVLDYAGCFEMVSRQIKIGETIFVST